MSPTDQMRSTLLAAFLFVTVALPCARAQIYFTGALQYSSDNTGTNNNGPWEYDTSTSPDTGNSHFTVNSATNIAFSLSPGSNAFALGANGPAATYQGLGLYFSATATPFVGPFNAVPNLVVSDGVSPGTTFFFASSGATVATYGAFSSIVSYSGATSYQVGGYEVTVTAFDYGAGGNNLTLLVTAIPEPAATGAMVAFVMLAAVLRRRRLAE